MTHEERLAAAVILSQMYEEEALVKVIENRKTDYHFNKGFDHAYSALTTNKERWREAMEALTGGPNEFQYGTEG